MNALYCLFSFAATLGLLSCGAAELEHETDVYGGLLSNLTVRVRLWPGLAPGETSAFPGCFAFDERAKVWRRRDVTCPELLVFRPTVTKSMTVVLDLPGGGYDTHYMGVMPGFGRLTLDSGRFYALLHYRIPRRPGRKIYDAAREDTARAVRWLRSHSAEYGWSPGAIGTVGFSAGGHLSAISAVSSQDRLYTPVDELDVVSPHLNFAVAVYPAYLLDDGATGPNANRGDDASLLPEFRFDSKTPPMLLVHGDEDFCSSMGSVRLYAELHRRRLPAQLMIYSGASHFLNMNVNVRRWREGILEWLASRGF